MIQEPHQEEHVVERSRHRETIAVGAARIVTCVDGTGPALVVLPSCGR